MGLSSWTTLELLRCINRQDQTVAVRVADVLGDIAKAVDLIAQRMQQGGRMVYGHRYPRSAGIYGRGGMPADLWLRRDAITCVMAGGRDAVFHAQEALEDHGEIARMDREKVGLRPADTVVVASASGRTPYCVALDYAQSLGCGRVALVCNLPGNGPSCGCRH